MGKLPEIKKTISSYLNEESGRITKHSALTIGAIVAAAALSSLNLKNSLGQTQHVHSHLSSPPKPVPRDGSY